MNIRETGRGPQGSARHTQECAAICLQTIQYCLEMGGEHTDPTHMQLLQDCADICQTTTSFIARRSAYHAGVTSSCADICDLCASACDKLMDDPQMKACANQCYLCASACRQMLSGTIAQGTHVGAPQSGLTSQGGIGSQAAPRQPQAR